jgi:FkbH-like protein
MKYSEIIELNNSFEGQVPGAEYKIAILSNIMVHQSKDICEYLLRIESLNAKIVLGEYDNIVQDSARFKDANAVVLFWEACNFVNGLQYKIELFSDQEFEDLVEKIKLEIDIVLTNLKDTPFIAINKFSSLIFNQFNLPNGKLFELTEVLNNYLKVNIGKNAKILNIDNILSRISIKIATDLRYYYSSKTLYSVKFYQAYFDHIKPLFLAETGKTKKALIFDCDNTLWKGTLGEDGFDGIKIFQEIQYLALQLSKKGVIIGLCSKNNPEDVNHVLENHPDMVLKNNDIVIKKVNWNNKISNLQLIAKELNIGIDSLVFIDDSSFEVELVKKELPDVKVFQVPLKEYEYGQMMRRVFNLFYSPSITKEDDIKTQMYKDQAKRAEEKGKAANIEDYLASLGILITVHVDNLSQVSRISQLTQKTNQFNLTTKRYSEYEINDFILSDEKIVISIEIDDKYGSSGLTGLAILCKKLFKIDTLLLSCRVLGRNIEYKFMEIIVNIANKQNIKLINSDYIKTQKNQQVKDFYSLCGFQVIAKSDDTTRYRLETISYKKKEIEYIKIKNGI